MQSEGLILFFTKVRHSDRVLHFAHEQATLHLQKQENTLVTAIFQLTKSTILHKLFLSHSKGNEQKLNIISASCPLLHRSLSVIYDLAVEVIQSQILLTTKCK